MFETCASAFKQTCTMKLESLNQFFRMVGVTKRGLCRKAVTILSHSFCLRFSETFMDTMKELAKHVFALDLKVSGRLFRVNKCQCFLRLSYIVYTLVHKYVLPIKLFVKIPMKRNLFVQLQNLPLQIRYSEVSGVFKKIFRFYEGSKLNYFTFRNGI